MPSISLTSRGVRATERIAGELARALLPSMTAGEPAPVIGLSGPMGAGKTAFVRGFVAALPDGAKQPVASPTWSLLNLYNCSPPVAHIDAWRLGASDDPETLGIELLSAGTIVIVEWIANVPQVQRQRHIDVTIVPRTANTRRIVVVCGDADAALITPISLKRTATQ